MEEAGGRIPPASFAVAGARPAAVGARPRSSACLPRSGMLSPTLSPRAGRRQPGTPPRPPESSVRVHSPRAHARRRGGARLGHRGRFSRPDRRLWCASTGRSRCVVERPQSMRPMPGAPAAPRRALTVDAMLLRRPSAAGRSDAAFSRMMGARASMLVSLGRTLPSAMRDGLRPSARFGREERGWR
jgi:hypothetical protein